MDPVLVMCVGMVLLQDAAPAQHPGRHVHRLRGVPRPIASLRRLLNPHHPGDVRGAAPRTLTIDV
jgi:hypothetical protein